MKNLFFLIAALFCGAVAFAHEEEAPAQETSQTAEQTPAPEAPAPSEETAQATQSPCGCTKN